MVYIGTLICWDNYSKYKLMVSVWMVKDALLWKKPTGFCVYVARPPYVWPKVQDEHHHRAKQPCYTTACEGRPVLHPGHVMLSLQI